MGNNSFERLVSGLSSSERKEMLDKMKAVNADTESLYNEDKLDHDGQLPFAEQIKKESLLYRFYLWLRALFANTSMEAIYNEGKIAEIARSIEKNSPHLIDNKRGLMLSSFYEKLSELNRCADFFRPYIANIEDDENDFLVFLGSLVMTEVNRRMDEEADPYTNPVTEIPKPEQRMVLLRKMESIMNEIPAQEKTRMYNAVRSTEWLKQFTKLPFKRFLAMFSSITPANDYSCSFSSLENEISSFSKILCNGTKIPEEVFEALFLYSRKKVLKKSLDTVDEVSEKAAEFMENARNSVSMMKMFISSVPMRSIGRVVYADAGWNPENFTGGEDWYQRYKSTWKKYFEQKWEAWAQDCQKEMLRVSLTRNFELESFPLLPERPWTEVWGGFPFRYELTAGFLYWFIKEVFPKHELCLKTVMLEGDFINKENRQEFMDAFNSLIQISVDFQGLVRRLSSGGEYGIILGKISTEKMRTLQSNSKVESIIHGLEGEIRSMFSSFCDSCRTIELCFTGIYQESNNSKYEGLSNLNHIEGHNNAVFQEKLFKAREMISNSYSLIRELETVDAPVILK